MALMLAEHELFDACRVLFGTDLNITRDFLEYLQASGLKTAYRKRALETHPDRIAALGISVQQDNNDLFRQVQTAYEDLTSYLDARRKGVIIKPSATSQNRWQYANNGTTRNSNHTRSSSSRTQKQQTHRQRTHSKSYTKQPHPDTDRWNIDGRFSGIIPERELRLGHYLYYSGLISWRQIIQALVWQRANRPRLGQLGLRFGWLDNTDILNVLRSRKNPEPFGEAAVNLGLLTEQQLNTLIWRQKSLQRRIGEFFVEENIIATEKLAAMIRLHQQHNAKINLANSRF